MLFSAWLGTGKYALAGPSTPTDNIWTGVMVGYGVLLLVAAIVLQVRYVTWLFWTTFAMAVLPVVLYF
jgi:hypothetical protein